MRKSNLVKLIFIFLVCGLAITFSVEAAQLESLNVGPHSALDKDYLEIYAIDLVQGKINISGSIVPISGVSTVLISLDAGENFDDAEGISPFRFSFIPSESEEYPILIKAVDSQGDSLFSKVIVVKYLSVDLSEEFDQSFEQIRMLYIDERLEKFLDFFYTEEYPNFTTFRKNMEDTFDKSTNFNLNISIRQIDLQREGDLAIVRVDWDKTFEDSSTQSGRNNEIHFKRKQGEWKIVYIKDDTIFIIGTGTISATY